jgi:uncharacterized cupin superfamily protein
VGVPKKGAINMPKKISSDEANLLGIFTNHELMENGEKRFRLNAPDGSAYIRTEASATGSWQNSHFHSSIHEMCIIQSGWAIFVEEIDGEVKFRRFEKGDYFVARAGIPHNLYASGGTVTHTVKFGDIEKSDWNAYPSLDEVTKCLSEKEALDKVWVSL